MAAAPRALLYDAPADGSSSSSATVQPSIVNFQPTTPPSLRPEPRLHCTGPRKDQVGEQQFYGGGKRCCCESADSCQTLLLQHFGQQHLRLIFTTRCQRGISSRANNTCGKLCQCEYILQSVVEYCTACDIRVGGGHVTFAIGRRRPGEGGVATLTF